ncbi:MAG: beta-propeller fold lactonase family protein [Verrucomicrobiales bacterium]|nr:beta-propeller fold lactonase family protein [Verrucomicrobiales bacterium]
MKLLPLFCLLITSILFPAQAIDTYIVAGQSNGWRLSQLSEDSDAEDTDGPKIHYFGMKCVSEPDESILVSLGSLNPSAKGTGLAQALLDKAGGEDIVFIQYCRCGAPVTGEKINSWWPGENPRVGESFDEGLFGLFETYLTKARAQVQSELEEDLEIKGLFWHQGESNESTDAALFRRTIRSVFWRFRDIIGNPKLPIVAGHIRELSEGRARVNESLSRIASRDPNLTVVPLSNLEFEPDKDGKPDVHIATAGCHELGREMVGAMEQLNSRGKPFHVYAPSRKTDSLWVVKATPAGDQLKLAVVEQVELGFSAATIAVHPFKKQFFVTSNRGAEDGKTPAAVATHTRNGISLSPFTTANGYSYLSLDRRNRFLLGCNYGDGFVDVYELDNEGLPGDLVSSLNEGRKAAHCVLVSPDNRYVYIPYVKDSNALYQYHFDPDMGALTALEKLDVMPPEGTGPRHLAYHPTQPILYFSNEQHLGVSVYNKADDGSLTIKQVCDITGAEPPEEGVSSSDIVITPDGRFLFAGIRGHKHDFDFISRYLILESGRVKHLGLTKADKIPWGLALSPDGKWLLATGFGEGTLMAYKVEHNGDLTRAGTLEWDIQISDLVTR